MDTASDAEWSRRMRPTLTLDLGTRAAGPAPDLVLSSPDVRLLKLASPELERLVLQQYNHQQHPQQDSSRERPVTLASEDAARGFVDVLLELHAQRQTDVNPASTPLMTSVATLPVAVFEASRRAATAAGNSGTSGSAQVTSSCDSPPTSPRGPEGDEEVARLERKRARNRLAATRCRNRKLERIDQLQGQADRLRAANGRLADEVKQLRRAVNQLRQNVSLHVGCQPAITLPPTFDNYTRYSVSESANRCD